MPVSVDELLEKYAPKNPPAKPATEDSLFGSLGNAFSRGWKTGKQALLLEDAGAPGLAPAAAQVDPEKLKEISRLQKEIEALPPSQWLLEVSKPRQEDEGIIDSAWRSLKSYASPRGVQAIGEIMAQSFGALIPVAVRKIPAAAAVGAAGGATVGSVIPGAGTIAGAGIGAKGGLISGVGLSSAAVEYTSSVLQTLEEAGVDVSDENALIAAFSNKELLDKAKSYGRKRGIAVGVWDGLSAGVAGKLTAPALKAATSGPGRKIAAATADTLVQGAMGGAGELTAQIATGQKIDPVSIIAEAIAEVPSGAAEVGLGTIGRLIESQDGKQSQREALDRLNKIREETQRKINERRAAVQSPQPTPTPTGSKAPTGEAAKPKQGVAPEQAQQDAAQGVVSPGDTRVVNGVTYTKRGEFWYYNNPKTGKEDIVAGEKRAERDLLEQLNAPQAASATQAPVVETIDTAGNDFVIRQGEPQQADAERAELQKLIDSAEIEYTSGDGSTFIIKMPGQEPFAAPEKMTPRAYVDAMKAAFPRWFQGRVEAGNEPRKELIARHKTIVRAAQLDGREVNPDAARYHRIESPPQTITGSNEQSGSEMPVQPRAQAQAGGDLIPADPTLRESRTPDHRQPPPENLRAALDALNIRYDGVQEGFGKLKPKHTITLRQTGDTIMVPIDSTPEQIQQAADAKLAERGMTRESRTAAPAQQTATSVISEIAAGYFGGALPENVKVVFDTTNTSDAWVAGGVIYINAARIDPRDVGFKLDHEIGHILFSDPELQFAFEELLNSLTSGERARIDKIVADLYSKAGDTGAIRQEELRVRALEEIRRVMVENTKNQTGWQRFVNAVTNSFLRLFGIQPVSREQLAAVMLQIGAMRVLTIPNRQLVASNATIVSPEMREIRESRVAHHGTPHKVDRFSTEKIGTGEGAQVYGWGIYLADRLEVADSYRTALATGTVPSTAYERLPNGVARNAERLSELAVSSPGIIGDFRSGDVEARRGMLSVMRGLLQDREIGKAVVRLVPVDVMDVLMGKKFPTKELLHNPAVLIDLFSVDANNPVSSRVEAINTLAPYVAFATAKRPLLGSQLAAQLSERLSAGFADKVEPHIIGKIPYPKEDVNTGNLYTVRLNVEPEQLLDWDKPLSEQSELVKSALIALQKKYGQASRSTQYLKNPEAYQGSALYDAAKHDAELFEMKTPDNWRDLSAFELKKLSDAAPVASKILASLGIRGIRYLDQGSRPQRYTAFGNREGKFSVYDGATGKEVMGGFGTLEEAESWIESGLKKTYNYVIFDDKDIEITHENGQPVSFSEATNDTRESRVYTTPAQVRRQNEIAATEADREMQLASAGMQNATLLSPLKAAAEAAEASPTVRALLGIQQIENVLATIPEDYELKSYDELMRETTNPGVKKSLQLDAFARLQLFRSRVERIRRKFVALGEYMKEGKFHKMLERVDRLKEAMDAKKEAAEQFQSTLAFAIARAEEKLKQATDVREAQVLQQEIAALKRNKEYKIGVAETIDQIVSALITDTDGLELLSKGGKASQYLGAWRRIRPGVQINTATARFAAYILERSKSVGPRLATLRELEASRDIQEEMTRFEEIVRNKVNQKGVTDIEIAEFLSKQFERAAKLTSRADRAIYSWFMLNRKITDVIKRYNDLEQAIKIGEATMASPEFRRIEKETQEAVGAVVIPPWWNDKKVKEAKAKYNTTVDPGELALMGHVLIVTPDGEAHPLALLSGDQENLDKEVERLSKLGDQIEKWLNENPDSPYAPFYRIQLDQIRGIYTTSIVTEANKNIAALRNVPLISRDMGVLQYVLRGIGTPAAKIAAKQAQAWAWHSEYMERWLKENYFDSVLKLKEAAASHGFDKDRLKDPNWWMGWSREVGNELMSRLQKLGSGVDVGTVLTSGRVVTRQDMAYVRHLQKIIEDAYKKHSGVLQSVKGLPEIEEIINNQVKILRERISNGDAVVPRRLAGGLGFYEIMQLMQTPSDPKTTLDAIDRALEGSEALWEFVVSYLTDRDPDYISASPFNDALALAGQRIVERRAAERAGQPYNGDAPAEQDMDSLYDFVARHIDTSESDGDMSIDDLKDLVREFVLGNVVPDTKTAAAGGKTLKPGELTQIIKNYIDTTGMKADHTKKADTVVLSADNSFTASRGRRIGPYTLYRNGLTDEHDFLNFRSSGSTYQLQMLLAAMRALKFDLENKKAQVMAKFGRSYNDPIPPEAVRKGKEDEKAGLSVYDISALESQIVQIGGMINDLERVFSPSGRADLFEMRRMSRVVGAVVRGVLSSGLVAIGNVFSPQEAMMRSTLNGAVLRNFAAAYGSLVKSLAMTAVGGLKATPEAVMKLFKGGDFLGAYEGILNAAMERGRINQELKRMGLDTPSTMKARIIAAWNLPETGGRLIPHQKVDGKVADALARMAGVGMTMADAFFSLFEPLQPDYGDRLLNGRHYSAGLDSINFFEERLRYLYGLYLEANQDPMQAKLTPDEIFGRTLAGTMAMTKGGRPTQTQLNTLKQWFAESGVPFRESVIAFFKRLSEAEGAEAKGQVQWLTETERDALATVFMFEANKATRANRPIESSTSPLYNLIFLLRGWSFFDITRKRHRMGRAASDKTNGALVLGAHQIAIFIALSALMGAFGWDAAEELKRLWARFVRGEERASRQWWEQTGTADKIQGAFLSAATQYPVVGWVAQWGLSDMPGTARADLNPLLLSKFKDLSNWIFGMWQTGDPTYGFDRFMKGWLGETGAISNKLPWNEGLVEMTNARRLLTRFGDKEMLNRTFLGGESMSSVLTPLHPIIEDAVNAIGKGDMDEFLKKYSEAIDKAQELGKTDPRRSVMAMLESRSPLRRAYKADVSQEQLDAILGRMNDRQRATVNGAINKFNEAISLVKMPSIKTVDVPSTVIRAPRGSTAIRTTLTPRSRIKPVIATKPTRFRRSAARIPGPTNVSPKITKKYVKPSKPSRFRRRPRALRRI